MVCIVLGANPPFVVFEGFINKLWGKLGIERIARMNAGYTLVKFRDEAMRDMILEAGVVRYDRKPVILRLWSTEFDTMRLVKSVPVWVRLPGLGLQYWGVKCLSALVSTIGKPMLVDMLTKDRSMVKFARVLVEVEISDNVPKTISFLNERGQLMERLLEYEWLPTQCQGCKILGHPATNCNRKQGAVWRKKEMKQGPKQSEDMIGQTIVEPPTDSCPKETDSDLILDDTQKFAAKEVCVTKPGQDSDWITPKRLGGVKQSAPATQNLMKNSYSALQDRIMEVTNLGLSTTNIFNGGLQHT
ncbi:uncharacterized protein LOC133821348 [Humulus lupulus]|uniref:uncharacterized protein LOC133821348 n=1 Tax=Humulus lupulus TaxID=3486 RepID=UPI002B408248|nr:uncharacterized protein LOC133821348 [Humulus lupulus]